jgi:hypothetical protein
VQAPPTIEPEFISGTVSGVIDYRRLHTLPLADRDFLDLALLTPGAYPVEQGSVLQGASLVVNGTRADMNNFLLDGTDNNDHTINQSLPFQIVEAMQEFRVQASTSTAEFGRSGGAQVNSVSRRGLSEFHGTLFEFFRNSALSANNFFSIYSGETFFVHPAIEEVLQSFGIPVPPVVQFSPQGALEYEKRKSLLILNQFGANVGGPLLRDKVFAFVNWESFRLSNPRPVYEPVPFEDQRNPALCREFPPFAMLLAKQGSASCDAGALQLFNLYPVGNLDPDPTGRGFASFAGTSANSTGTDNFLGRVDWQVGNQDLMSFKYNIQQIDQIQGGSVPATANYPGNGTDVNGQNQNFSYNYVHQFGQASNEFRLGWNRFHLDALAQDRTLDPSALFHNLNFVDQGLPTFRAILRFPDLGAELSVPSSRADEVWSAADNFTYPQGRHTWRFGAEAGYIRLNVTNAAFGRGLIAATFTPFVVTNGRLALASIARMNSQFAGGFDRSFRSHFYSGFLQDQWRPRPSLTLNYGIRYEINTAPVESRNRLVNYYPDLGGLVQAGQTNVLSPFLDSSGNLHLMGQGPSPAPRAGFYTDANNWAPRVGFAWSPRSSGKTVVRGGFAIAFDQQPLEPSVNMLLNPPFVQQDFGQATPAKETGSVRLQDVFSVCGDGFSDPACLSTNPHSTSAWVRRPYSITARDPHTRTPYVYQFHFGIQQQLGSAGLLEVAYVGSAGHKLPRSRDASSCTLESIASQPSCSGSSNVFESANSTLNLVILNEENSANSTYNSLQVRLATRDFHRAQLQALYQFAKSIDDASSLQAPVFLLNPLFANNLVYRSRLYALDVQAVNSLSPALSLQTYFPVVTTRPTLPQDSTNLRAERGLSDFDVRHRLVFDYIYDVPSWNYARALGRGWQLAGITTLETGQPYSVYFDFFGTPLRPNVVKPVNTNNHAPSAAIDSGNPLIFPVLPTPWDNLTLAGPLNPASAFRVNFDPKTGFPLPGNLGRNTFTGPSLINWDFSILKNTYLGKHEAKTLQFRVEFFNLFNNVNFLQPYSLAGEIRYSPTKSPYCTSYSGTHSAPCLVANPFFGKILQARPARQIQFAVNFTF